MTILVVLQVFIAIALIAIILVQKGAGATGSAFGAGASSTVFGASGAGSFLTKTTSILAFCFIAICLAMVVVAKYEAAQTVDQDIIVVADDNASSDTDDVPQSESVEVINISEDTDLPLPTIENTNIDESSSDNVADDVPTADAAASDENK